MKILHVRATLVGVWVSIAYVTRLIPPRKGRVRRFQNQTQTPAVVFRSNDSIPSLSHESDNRNDGTVPDWDARMMSTWAQRLTNNDTPRQLQDAAIVDCSQCPVSDEGCTSDSSKLSGLPLIVQILLIVCLLAMSALFSGLTLGLMGLDCTGLEIVMEGGDPKNAAYARKIYPIRKNGNLLLTTLLLGNVSVNSLLSILMADKTGGAIGLVSSTFLIVVVGEIIPQAFCSRYPLRVGSMTIPIVKVIIALVYPVAKPLAWSLDRALGEELATTYSNSEMLKLLQIHVNEKVIDPETAVTMTGALQYKDITVKQVMTPLANTFMLSSEERLNFESVAKIFKAGYSRIPVYEISKNNVIGLLFVKDLIFIDPEDETRVADFVDIFGRGLHVVWPDDKLGDVLRELRKGRSHMALVRDVNNNDETSDPYYEIKGIITLEDIIEEILGGEIVDETDAFVDGSHMVKVDREETFKWARLRLLDSKIVDETLSLDETRAVTAHLAKNYPQTVQLLSEHQLHRLVAETPITILPTATHIVGQQVPDDLLYEKGIPSDVCTLILSGKVTVLAGADRFRTDVSSWCLLAPGALENVAYQPDFTAFVSSGPCRCLRWTRSRFVAAMDASVTERVAQSQNHGNDDDDGTSSFDNATLHLNGTSSGNPNTLVDASLVGPSATSNNNMGGQVAPPGELSEPIEQGGDGTLEHVEQQQQQQQHVEQQRHELSRKAKIMAALQMVVQKEPSSMNVATTLRDDTIVHKSSQKPLPPSSSSLSKIYLSSTSQSSIRSTEPPPVTTNNNNEIDTPPRSATTTSTTTNGGKSITKTKVASALGSGGDSSHLLRETSERSIEYIGGKGSSKQP